MRRLNAAAAAELLQLQQQYQEQDVLLLRRAVFEFGKNPKTALHHYFEWDRDKGWEQHNLAIASRLIQLVITVHPATNKKLRVLVSLSNDRSVGGGYRHINDVMANPEYRAVLLQDALSALRLLQSKYEHLVELQDVWEAVDAVGDRNVLAWTAAQAIEPGPSKKRRGKPPRQPSA